MAVLILAVAIGVMAMPLVIIGVASAGTLLSDGAVLCAGGGTGETVAGVPLDPEQVGNADAMTRVTAGRGLSAYAAVVAVDTSFTEASLRNSTVEADHDSEGLFQQRVSIYTETVADDPVKATNAFLDRLIRVPGWQTNPVGDDAQAVQVSEFPQRYQTNAALAEQLVNQLWPSAAAGAQPACPGGGGASRGAAGSNVAGTTTIPPGFVLTGSLKAQTAIRFALAQLGKPYVFGAAGPDAFDCSGLTMAAWAAAGIALPHWTVAQAAAGTPEPTDLSLAVGGDLVLIPGSDGTAQAPGHVGMIVGYVQAPPTPRVLYLLQAPETSIPVELTPISDWAGQVVAVRHIA